MKAELVRTRSSQGETLITSTCGGATCCSICKTKLCVLFPHRQANQTQCTPFRGPGRNAGKQHSNGHPATDVSSQKAWTVLIGLDPPRTVTPILQIYPELNSVEGIQHKFAHHGQV